MESMGLSVGKEKATAKKKQKKTKADAGSGTPPRVAAPRRSSRLQSEHDLDGFRGVRSTLCAAAADALAPGGAAVEVMTGFRVAETDKGALEVGACAGGFMALGLSAFAAASASSLRMKPESVLVSELKMDGGGDLVVGASSRSTRIEESPSRRPPRK